jgi:hypothetical protein
MKALVATAMLTLALLGSTGSAFACKDGKCCDCCGDKATKTETAPAPHH